MNLKYFFIFFYMCTEAVADCTGIISLPLSMVGTQNQLMWSGNIGGAGAGSTTSNCASAGGYQYDYRYNIVATEAICRNQATNVQYRTPLETLSAEIQTGHMRRAGQGIWNGIKFDFWGALFNSPAVQLPLTGAINGSYSTRTRMDISKLPAGKYSCFVYNSHGAYGTNNPNALNSGANAVWALTRNNNLWATGYVNVEVFSSCAVQNAINISHGLVAAGGRSIQQQSLQITCNKDNVVNVLLKGNENANSGVWVNVGNSGSRSLLSVSGGTGSGKQTSLSVRANTPQSITLKSELSATGYGNQSGSALAVISYH